MMNNDEFRKFATKHLNVSPTGFDQYKNYINAQAGGFTNYITPYIIEERPMNVTSMDVFSRLMMDRIIFLGVPIDDMVGNVITAQLLFLESLDTEKDIVIYINSPGGSVYAGLGIYDTMEFIKPDVATICTGLAASMGAVLLTAGKKRKKSSFAACARDDSSATRRRARTGFRHRNHGKTNYVGQKGTHSNYCGLLRKTL